MGVIKQADVFQILGVTALWLSPLFEQVDVILQGQARMHGFWIRDFKRLNPHLIRIAADCRCQTRRSRPASSNRSI